MSRNKNQVVSYKEIHRLRIKLCKKIKKRQKVIRALSTRYNYELQWN